MVKHRGESAEYALSQHQVGEVLKVCQDSEDRILVGLQLFMGLRIGECVHMNATWVTQEGDLRIPQQQACHCAECVRVRDGMWTPKTKAGARTIPIPQRMKKDLAELFKVRPYGLDMSRQGLYYRTKNILKRARVKFKGLSGDTGFPHCLRSTCASMLVVGEINEFHLCYIMGWSDINMAKHYVQLFRVKPKAIQAVRNIFG